VAPETVWTGAENLAPTGIRSSDRPTRRELLYRLMLSRPGTSGFKISTIQQGNNMHIHIKQYKVKR
jgi:hypothetical protein